MDTNPVSTSKPHSYWLWVVALAVAVGVALAVNYWASKAQAPLFGYMITRTDSNSNTVQAGGSASFTYFITNVGTATGNDQVTIEVLDQNWTALPWCSASPSVVPISGVGGAGSFVVMCTPSPSQASGPTNINIRTNSASNQAAGSWSTNSTTLTVNMEGGLNSASAEYYSYSLMQDPPTATTSIQYGSNMVFNYRISQTDARASGSDTVTLGVYQNSALATWCYVPNPPSITMTGPSAQATFSVSCNPTAAQLGSPSLLIKAQSIKEQAAGRPGLSEVSLNVSVIAPTVGGGGASIIDSTQTCYYNASTSTYGWYATPPGPNWTAMPSSSCPTGTPPGTSNMVNHTWNFKDGQTSNSMILSRTDSEYTNYIAQIHAQCMTINMNQFGWKPNAGDSGSSNWQNFGIPNCSGTATGTNTTGQICYYNASTAAYGWYAAPPSAAWVATSSTSCSGGTGTTPPVSPGTVNRTWNFKDGSTSSAILDRTDAEYTNYLATVSAQCLLINMNQYSWKSGAGDSSAANWQNFGIPNCSGTAVTPPPTPASSCYKHNTDSSYAWFAAGNAGPNWTAVDRSFCDALKSTCYKKSDGTYGWVTPTGFMETDWVAVADSFCFTVIVPPTPIPGPGVCKPGTKCPENFWCDMGNRCFYPDGQITCTAGWDARCSDGTKYCRPGDTNCIEPGAYGPLNSWCAQSMECFTDTQKYCAPQSMSAGPVSPKCPTGTKYCSPNDTNCIEPGARGSLNGWCKNSSSCYLKDGSGVVCVEWQGVGTAAGAEGGYTPAMTWAVSQVQCPSGSGYCRPDDKNCIEPGSSGPKDGWCAGGTPNRCFRPDGTLYCPKMGEPCPSDSSVCPANDTNCIEPGKYGPENGWCGGSSSVMCYKPNRGGIFCGKIDSYDPAAWNAFKCPSGTSRCREDDKYCLEVGETCESSTGGCWCTNGRMEYKNGKSTCVDGMPGKEDEKKEEEKFACFKHKTNVRDYARLSLSKAGADWEPADEAYCSMFALSCYKKPDGSYVWVSSTGMIETTWVGVDREYCSKGDDGTPKGDPPFECLTNMRYNPEGSFAPMFCQIKRPACFKNKDGSYKWLTSKDPFDIDRWSWVADTYCPFRDGGDDKICVWNPDYSAVQDEISNLGRMEKGLNYAEGDEKLKNEIRSKIKNAYKTLESLAKQASETSCGARDVKAFEAAFQKFRNEVLRPIEEAFKGFGEQGDLTHLGREIKMRLEYLTKDRERFIAEGDTQAVNQLDQWIQSHQALLADLEAKVSPQEIRAKLMALEAEMRVFFEGRHKEGRNKFLDQMIENIRQNLAMARQMISERPVERCKAASEAVEKIASIVNDAEAIYKAGEVKMAAALLEKAEKAMAQRLAPAMHRCIGDNFIYERVDIEGNFDSVIGVSAEDIEKIVAKVTETLVNKIQVLVDEKLKEIVARVSELQSVAQEKVTQSLEQLQAVSEQYRETLTAVKQELVEKVQALEQLAEETVATLRAADKNRLYKALEVVSTYNWCGRLGDELQAEADNMILAFESGRVKAQDITDFEKKVSQAAAQNAEACYVAGASRFRDTPTHEWYFAPCQDPRWQGTQDAEGRLTGNLEPARDTLAAEAVLTVMRTTGYENIEGECALQSAVTDPTHVPAWSSCAANVAAEAEILPTGPLDQPIEREEVARMMVAVMEDQGILESAGLGITPAEAPVVLAPYSDIRTCDVPPEVIATMVQAGIMTGNPDGTWNCDGHLNRAELATVLDRFDELIEFYAPEGEL